MNVLPLHNILKKIEESQYESLTIERLAKTAYLSESHLQLLFRQISGQSIKSYARGRKLAHCLDDLFQTDMRIIDIAYKYGFAHEQSFVRAFKAEFGHTPGNARKEKKILKIRECIMPENLQNSDGGFLYGPEHVIVPAFTIAGVPTLLNNYSRYDDTSALEPNRLGNDAFYPILSNIPGADCTVYYGLCNWINESDVIYMPGVAIKKDVPLPEGLERFSFPVHRCVRFRYIGQHPIEELSIKVASDTYDLINHFFRSQQRYTQNKNYHYERIDGSLYDGVYCQMELMYPVRDNYEEEYKI